MACLVVSGLSAICPTVRRGSGGECVRTLQRVIGVTPDGIFGNGTEAAVRAYQSGRCLVSDGIVGPATWGAINADDVDSDGLKSCPTVRRGSRGECVKILQKAVGVEADGIFGRNTEAATKIFQSRKDLVSDGIVGIATWAAINEDGRPKTVDYCTGSPERVICGNRRVDFWRGCKKHDKCYENRSGRKYCDKQFLKDLNEQCAECTSGLRKCHVLASAYYLAVRAFGWLFYSKC